MRTIVKLLLAGVVPFATLIILLPATAQSEKSYVGFEKRAIKALSDQQIADLRAGRGMMLALAAELNGYPGPLHVLENAEALRLTQRQQDRTKSLLASMKNEAIPLGMRLIEQEATLDDLFAEKKITAANLAAATQAIALTEASLRQTHLKYHMAMMDVLSPQQISLYRELRGYAGQGGSARQHEHKHN
jgi:hypothetical protein